jgi:hypothetical protein
MIVAAISGYLHKIGTFAPSYRRLSFQRQARDVNTVWCSGIRFFFACCLSDRMRPSPYASDQHSDGSSRPRNLSRQQWHRGRLPWIPPVCRIGFALKKPLPEGSPHDRSLQQPHNLNESRKSPFDGANSKTFHWARSKDISGHGTRHCHRP